MVQPLLLVEDTTALARTYRGFLQDEPYELTHVETGAAARDCLTGQTWAGVLLDLRLPDTNGMEILAWIQRKNIDCPVVVITAHGSINTAVEAMQAGASDFLVKPFSAERLKTTLANVLQKQQLTEIVQTYQEQIDRRAFEGFIGSSLAMQAVYRGIESAATSSASVFVTGESGTGKELCAQAIHNLSKRSDGPFVEINCAAIPHDLMESEIFGHVKGAFTGAVSDRIGAAAQADGGTLFLDEICEMDPLLQSKLLRFIQTGRFNRVGGKGTDTVDVRFVCATNRDPLEEVKAGRFREDLFYRLHVLPLGLPPLRERGEDVVEIASDFLPRYAAAEGRPFQRLSAEAESALKRHSWPGNVRELQNAIRKAVVLHADAEDREELPVSALPGLNEVQQDVQAESRPLGPADPAAKAPKVTSQRQNDFRTLAEKIRPIEEVERQAIENAIALCEGNIRKAAVFLGIAPATIYRRLEAWRSSEGPS